jgi:hypothetical protein
MLPDNHIQTCGRYLPRNMTDVITVNVSLPLTKNYSYFSYKIYQQYTLNIGLRFGHWQQERNRFHVTLRFRKNCTFKATTYCTRTTLWLHILYSTVWYCFNNKIIRSGVIKNRHKYIRNKTTQRNDTLYKHIPVFS